MKKKESKKLPERNTRNMDKKEPRMEKKKKEPMKKERR